MPRAREKHQGESRSRKRTPATLLDPRDESVLVRLQRAARAGTFPKELLISGPAGTGKTLPILTFLHAIQCDYPETRGLILRTTRASLTESALVTFEQEVLTADSMEWMVGDCQRGNRRNYLYPNSSETVVAGLDRNADKVLSTAWDWVYWNEASQARQDTWETILTRMDRMGRDQRFGWLIGDLNPATPDHFLLKRIEKGLTHWETTHKANPSMWDGHDWTEKGRRYLARLNNLTGLRRKRFLQGLWVAGEGVWFDTFDPDIHVRPEVRFEPALPLYASLDTGVCSGGVIFQLAADHSRLWVLADYYAEGRRAAAVADEMNALCQEVAPSARMRVASCDSAGDARNANGGPVVTGELLRQGFASTGGGLIRWPKFPGCITQGLELIDAFMGGTTDVPPALFVHPRCKHLIAAFQSYRRATRGGSLMDYPEDPQHPHEDVIDALRGGLMAAMPQGRRPQPRYRAVKASRVV